MGLLLREVWLKAGGTGLLGGGGLAGEEVGELLLHAEFTFTLFALFGFGSAVGLNEVGVLVVFEAGVEDVDEEFFVFRTQYGRHEFDPLFEVAAHPIGRADEDFLVSTLVEIEDSHMLEFLVDDGDDFDVFSFFAFAGFEAANATDIKLDFNACFGGPVEGFDHVDVFEGIHLSHDVGCFTFEGAGCFFFDEGDEGSLDLGGSWDEDFEVF